jgi:hypothetical protein
LHIILGMQIYIPNTSHISMNQNPVWRAIHTWK